MCNILTESGNVIEFILEEGKKENRNRRREQTKSSTEARACGSGYSEMYHCFWCLCFLVRFIVLKIIKLIKSYFQYHI